ncbi:hypothetical protein DdX_11238 [Ditylenchus destructor]|uniref:Uncharacterized protein n=1 Tax=Ditylenchus destructor TaxID=166010 RepID=A0AAD4N2T9_9BILA|nr:hypothetical protein DdX_11238 [Ditylenchus destructor]
MAMKRPPKMPDRGLGKGKPEAGISQFERKTKQKSKGFGPCRNLGIYCEPRLEMETRLTMKKLVLNQVQAFV